MLLALLVAPVSARADQARARALVAEAAEAKARGDLQGALQKMRQAFSEDPQPVLLGNVARLLELLGRYGEAYLRYREVLEMPAVRDEVRTEIAARVERLAKKRTTGFLMLEDAPPEVYIDGREPLFPSGEEWPYRPGRRFIEVVQADRVRLHIVDLEAGLRTTLAATSTAGTARLVADEAMELTVDGYRFRSRLGRQPIHVPAGRRAVKIEGDAGAKSQRLQLKVGEEMRLALPLPELQVAAPPPPPEAPSLWPLLPTVAGAVGMGVGGLLLGLGHADASKISDADANGDGVAEGLTERAAFALEDSSREKGRAGVAMLSVGGALVVTGIVWWLLD